MLFTASCALKSLRRSVLTQCWRRVLLTPPSCGCGNRVREHWPLSFVTEDGGQRPARIRRSVLRGAVDPRILGKDTSCAHVWKGHFQLWFPGHKRPPN